MPFCKLPAQQRSNPWVLVGPMSVCVCVPVAFAQVAHKSLVCRSPVPGPRMAVMKSAEDRVKQHINEKYLRSKDIENPDSIDFCAYFEQEYGNKLDELKAKFQKIEEFLRHEGWNPPEHIVTVVSEDPDDMPEFWAAPWQLGLTEAHSVKGKSKLVNILDVVSEFLKKPYNSKNEPLQTLFGPRSPVGATVEDWSMVLSIGMGKASACRMILEAVSAMNLDPEDLRAMAPKLKALLRMRCTYDPAPTEEAQLEKAFADKNKATERPRPCPLMMAIKWNGVIQKQGLHFASVIDSKLKKFNSDKEGGFGILEHEIQFIKAYPHQAKEYIDTLASHWQNFKLNESAVPPKRLAFIDLSPDSKVKRCEKTNVLFMKIFTWTATSNVFWLLREIGVFLRAIRDAQRANKKINLRTNAKAFRSKPHELSHDEICIFVHFMPEFQQHTTAAQMEDLINRLCRGYLDKELNEKARLQDPKLTVHDFRFLSMITGKQSKVQGPGSATLEQRAESIEVEQFKDKLKADTDKWILYRRSLQVWQSETRKLKREDNQTQEKKITEFADKFCTDFTPVSRLSEDGVVPYICECISHWCEKQELSKENIRIVFLVRLDVLGQKYHTNLNPAIRILSDCINQDPQRTSGLVFAPNTGKDDVYNEVAIDEAIQEVDDHLREETYAFRVRRGSIDLEEESLGPRSNRPGFCTVWRIQSSARSPDNPKKFCSDFEQSYFFRRGKTEKLVPVLTPSEFVNPVAALVRQAPGAEGLSKAQRSKQWHTGEPFWEGVTSSILKGLGLRVTDGIVWIDLCPYDDKLMHSIVRAYARRSAQVPTQMVISPIWANMGHHGQGNEAVDKVDNARVENFLKKSVRNFTASRIRDKTLTFSEVPVVDSAAPATSAPALDLSRFVKTCPNAAGFLPLRQDILDLLEQKVQSTEQKEAIQKIIAEHNKNHNPSGVPFKGEAKRPAPATSSGDAEARAAKTYPAEVQGPKSRDEFDAECIMPGQSSDHEFIVKEGKLWAYAVEDCVISAVKPCVKFWGEYLCGSERKKDIAKFKNEHYMWEVNSYDFVGAFGFQKGKAVEEYKHYRPSKLSEFMAHLEDKGRVNVSMECHSIKEITESTPASVQGPSVPGSEEIRYEIKSTEDCLFHPKAVPAKNKPSRANAGSAMDFSKWIFKQATHKLGRVKLMPTMHYDEEANSIIPVKPMVYLTHPIKMSKGTFVLLG